MPIRAIRQEASNRPTPLQQIAYTMKEVLRCLFVCIFVKIDDTPPINGVCRVSIPGTVIMVLCRELLFEKGGGFLMSCPRGSSYRARMALGLKYHADGIYGFEDRVTSA